MIAYNRKPPDESRVLLPETVDALRAALTLQAKSGQEPTQELRDAIRRAATDARERTIAPEFLIVQLKELLTEAATEQTAHGAIANRGVQSWLVTACFRAYWNDAE